MKAISINVFQRLSKVVYWQTVICAFLSLFSSNAIGQTPDVSQSGGVLVRNGGGIRGIVAESEDKSTGICSITPTLGGLIQLDAENVKQTTVLRKEQIEYRKFASLQPDSVQAQLKVAKWAADKKLSALADAHYQRVVELDPENAEARRYLQHVKVNGQWVSKKEKREQLGLVRMNGRDVSKQEAELLEKDATNKEATRYWNKEIRALYSNARSGDMSQRDALRSVRNPLALPAVAHYFQSEKDPEGRILLIQVMSSIGTPTALSELGRIALHDPDPDARAAAVEGIYRKRLAADDAVEYFRKSLRSSDEPAEINNAAYALERLMAESAIPDLINALVTYHKRQVFVGTEQTGASFDSSGHISGFSPGPSGKMKTEEVTSPNESVHKALVTIVKAKYPSPVDFGYDVDAWIRWKRGVDQLANFYPRRDR